jgi:hypothetical protein
VIGIIIVIVITITSVLLGNKTKQNKTKQNKTKQNSTCTYILIAKITQKSNSLAYFMKYEIVIIIVLVVVIIIIIYMSSVNYKTTDITVYAL